MKALTDREFEVLALTAKGLFNKEIAAVFGISICTVKIYRRNILAKMKARNATHAVVMAFKCGMLTLDAFSSTHQ